MADRRHAEEPFIRERRRGGDRRHRRREAVQVPVELTAGGRVYYHLTADLSAAGIRLDRALPLLPGTVVHLTVELPGAAPVRCAGEVVRENGERGLGTGLRLLDAAEADRARIERFLARDG